MALLAIPDICTDKIITLYHSSLFSEYQDVIKIYLTISDTFFIQSLVHYLHSYIKGCHIWQLSRNKKTAYETVTNQKYFKLQSIIQDIMDLKVMPRSNKGHKYILYIIDEVTNYLITVLIHQSRLKQIGNAITENIITKYCVPDYIIMDQDGAFMSSLMNYLFKKLDIRIKTIK